MKSLMFFMFLILAMSVDAQNSAKISGNLSELTDDTQVKIIPGATHTEAKPIAETVIKNGQFSVEFNLDEPRLFYVNIDGHYISVMLTAGDVLTITGTLANPVVSGSEIHKQYVKLYEEPRAALNKAHADYNERYRDILRKLGEARQSGNNELYQELSESEEGKAFAQAEGDFFKLVGESIDNSILAHKDSWWGPFLLLANTSFLTPEQISTYDQFSEVAKNSYYGKLVKEEISPSSNIGSQAKAFQAKDVDGKVYSLEQLLNGNNYLLVDFWASWCAPCRKFVPKVKEFAETYKDKGLAVVSISTDKDRGAWIKAMEEEQMPWINLLDESGISGDYGVKGIPSIFLLDSKGTILFEKLYGDEVEKQLKQILGE